LAASVPGAVFLWALAVLLVAYGGYVGFETRYRRV
jgi:hypothetical protein